jgi:hypothetical protein
LAVAEGVELELSLYGGAVFTLVYGSRLSTKDVDGLLRPTEIGRRLARLVAVEQGLAEDWINGMSRSFWLSVKSGGLIRKTIWVQV